MNIQTRIAEQIEYLKVQQDLIKAIIAEETDSRKRRFNYKRLVRNIKSRYVFESYQLSTKSFHRSAAGSDGREIGNKQSS
jgi:hypothetical protein